MLLHAADRNVNLSSRPHKNIGPGLRMKMKKIEQNHSILIEGPNAASQGLRDAFYSNSQYCPFKG